MKKLIPFILFALIVTASNAQMGIGTTTPNSTLDVRGSLSTNYRSFATATSATITDNVLVFTGTSAFSLTLPDALACPGRAYWIKNVSANSSVLTIITTSSQTIDGLSSWLLTQTNKTVQVISNGANWYVASESLPGGSLTGSSWLLGGNSVAAPQNFGNITNYDLPFITNNTEKMRLSAGGNLGIGATVIDGANAEKLMVDAGTTSYNVISGRGNNTSFLQLNIKNINAGATASSDVVATNDFGNEANAINYVDMGINSSGNTSTGVLGGANTGYLYSTGSDFSIGNATSGKSLLLFTTAIATSNERMRIDSSGRVGIGLTVPTALLHLKAGSATANTAPLKFTSGPLMTTAAAGAVEFLTDKFFGTITTGAARKEFALNETSLASTRVPFTNVSGRLTDLATFTYATNRLSPTYITLGAGTATAGTAPLVFTTGAHLTVPVTGAVEFNGTHFYGTIGSTRYQLDQQTANTWSTTGNSGILSGTNFLGTTDNQSLKIKGNNIQGIMVDSLGNVGIGTTPSFTTGTYQEKFLIDAGVTGSYNPIVVQGSIDTFFQFNIQNLSTGTHASSDIVATSNNGTETSYYVDMGINGSGNTSNVFGRNNDAYIYNAGENFFIATSTPNKSLIFLTGGTDSAANGRMRIDGSGNVGIATNSPGAKLDVGGNFKLGAAGTTLNSMIHIAVATTTSTTGINFSTTTTTTLAVPGATVGGSVLLNPRVALPTGILISYSRVSASNTVEIGFLSGGSSSVVGSGVTFDVTIIQ